MDDARKFLRHTVATVAYRGGKAVRGAPPNFATFKVGDSSKTPAQILAHIGDLFDWAVQLAKGVHEWEDSVPLEWEREIARFHISIENFDDYLKSTAPLDTSAAKLFQGPVADALTHVGQLAMLRRLAGMPMKSENYFEAEIVTGRVGPRQTPPRKEFD